MKQIKQRQQRLLKMIGEQGLAVLWAADLQFRNTDTEHPFRQDSHFSYMTEFPESDAVVVFAPQYKEGEVLLFCQPKNPNIECWNGEIIGPDKAVQTYGFDAAFELSELSQKLPEIMANRTWVYADIDQRDKAHTAVMQSIQQVRKKSRLGIEAPQGICFLTPMLSELRLIKDAEEIGRMKQAAHITVEAHKKAMLAAQHSHYEYEVQAVLEQTFKHMGAQRNAFNSIVAAGANACVLHYVQNNAALNEDSIMLIDAGAEYQGYASDVTTAFPTRGQFSGPQKAVYELVLSTHRAALNAVKVGSDWQQVHQLTCKNLTEGLIALDILQGDCDTLVEQEAYKPWFMHRTGHWLGRDVHDVGSYQVNGQWRKFKSGMALTIEPGLYFTPSPELDEKWWGIGVRIEDSVIITDSGHDNLTADIPRTVADIEAFLR